MAKLILVVDDDEALLDMLTDLLTGEGYRVETAFDVEVEAKARTLQPDLIILDIYMPVISGVILSHRLKNSVQTAHIPIIGSSASGERRGDAQKMAVDAFVSKPFEFDTLLGLITRLL